MDQDDARELLIAASRDHNAGRLREAAQAYAKVLHEIPNHPEANHNFGIILMQTGQGADKAKSFFHNAWVADPTHRQHWMSYIKLLRQMKDDTALAQVLADGRARGLLEGEAKPPPERIPDPSMKTVETAQAAISRLEKLFAEESYHSVIETGKPLLDAQPDATEVLLLVMRAHMAVFRHDQALVLGQNALERSADVRLMSLLVKCHMAAGEENKAMELLEKCLEQNPHDTELFVELFELQQGEGHTLSALASADRFIASNPSSEVPLVRKALLLSLLGELDDALELLDRALSITPSAAHIWSCKLSISNYSTRVTPAESLHAATEFGRMLESKAKPFTEWAVQKEPERLRVGIVSGDLNRHPVAYFLEEVLRCSDRIEWFAYSTQSKRDDVSRRIEQHVAQWRDMSGLSIQNAARTIHSDGIHILLDLSGHTDFNALPVFAYKPAPIQASWLGYFATTGLSSIDYVISDPTSSPPALQSQFCEALWQLPVTRLCFSEPAELPPVSELPALKNGYVTFGSFQRLNKYTDDMLACWSRLLERVPSARLCLQGEGFEPGTDVHDLVKDKLGRAGIDLGRVTLLERQSREEYFRSMHNVDLLLDTFPFNGATTTCEALWMGLPTVTLSGDDRMVARQGALINELVGLSDLVADSFTCYEDIAVDLAGDVERLTRLRAQLRQKMSASPLCDASAFATAFADALEDMWRVRKMSL